jgi:hypothetical protein
MKYLLLLLAPVLLSSSSRDHGSGTTLKLIVNNRTECTLGQIGFTICVDGECSETEVASAYFEGALQERTVERYAVMDDAFICRANFGFAYQWVGSSWLTFRSDHCSGSDVAEGQDCAGNRVYMKKTSQSGNEIKVEIYYP